MPVIVFLTGFMGSGKSSLGKKLARHLGFSFMDTDKEIERLQKMTVQEIFQSYGEPAFRELEHELLHKLEQASDTLPNLIVATGGGMPCTEENTRLMHAIGTVIYLRHPAGQLASRLHQRKGKRPLLEGLDEEALRAFVQERLSIREPFYLRADLVAPPEDQQVSALAAFIRRNAQGKC